MKQISKDSIKKLNISKVPYLGIPDEPIRSSTQSFVPIADVTEDIVISKEGGAAVVLESTSLNFGLLSEKEQEAVIAAYAALLNSLSFPIQIVIRSQVKDITNYMDYLSQAESKIVNPKLASIMKDYKMFITETIKKKNVLGKSFYIVIPFSPLELGVTKSAMTIAKKKGPLPYPKSYVVKKAKIALYPKRDHLVRQAARLGIKVRQLTTDELITLYFRVFNPTAPTIVKTEVKLAEAQK